MGVESSKPRRTAWRLLRLARFHRFVAHGGAAVALVMVSLCMMALYEGRQEALQRARETSQNLLLILQKDISRNVELYDLSLQSVVEGSQRADVMALPSAMRREVLFDRSTRASYLGALLVLDAKGNVTIDSENLTPRQANFSDREYFTIHRDHPNVGLYLSEPFRSRLRNGKWTVVLSRRVTLPDGSFGGVALVAISIEYFQNLLGGLDIGNHGVLMLIGENGALISRQPDRSATGHSLVGSDNFNRFQRAASGTFAGTGTMDGVRHLYSFARIPGVPVIAVVGPAEDDILENWWRRSVIIGGLMLAFSAVFLFVSWLLAEELRERALAQHALLEQATHDKLTGIANRHALDETLSSEWRRARRESVPLAVLFIDVDAFKAYNDRYGHSAGDVALTAVARAISECLHRPADSVGRYGGEEFVVVLPETPLDGALRVAESIRERVARLAIGHDRHSFGVVTVSVGVALSDSPEVESLVELITQADKALYRAKEEGRNAVRAA
jgi:diguanylate cyclase (GGDEF)-like protein